jgi:hypothetical protein
MYESHQELKKSNKQIFDQKVTEWMLKITIFPTKALQKIGDLQVDIVKGGHWAGKMSVGIRIRIRIRMFIYLLPLYTYNVK